MLDLFAGAGGLTAGFHAASKRFRTARAVEMDLAAAASYEQTFGAGLVYAGAIQDWLDEETVPENIDVVVGGPPCQGFSTLGKQDAEDSRNSLWRQYAETIVRANPKYFVVENVAAFGKSKQFGDFEEAVSESGFLSDYAFEFKVLNAADFGAHQSRKRAVLIGHHRDLSAPGFPAATHVGNHGTVRQAFQEVPVEPDSDPVYASRSVEFMGKVYAGSFSPRELHLSRNYSELSLSRFAAIPTGGNRFDLPDALKAPCWIKHTNGSGDVMGRLHADRPSVTIRTEFFKPEKGRYLHPEAMRAITHYEAAILQGFPDSHRFVGSRTAIARQIGNAVPIPLGQAIGRHLAALI
ncbi:DNA cytosine methyltransferase [Salinibacterium sp. NK8237]|uniref:DNA cytosine methyltransferase n=1 Tax=Salinibacterium sp. NK8237 TaxID=2792038 RepID=UPI0027DB4D96|nr:DNA cytosine methyltransferase [Salinibacterium sp. NK8237]